MPYDRFMIAPFDSGLDKSASKFLLPEDAYQRMNNAYVYKGKILKRFGSRYMGADALKTRLRINLGDVKVDGTFAGNVPGNKFKIGQQFSIGTDVFTVVTTGAVKDMLKTGGATIATYSTTDGAYNFTGASAGTAVYFYPSEPVMGFANLEYGPVNDHPAYAYDTQFAYLFSGDAWNVALNTPTWTGTDSDFFWTINWHGQTNDAVLMFTTNFNATDSMYYFNRATSTWTAFAPLFNATNFVQSARIIVPFDGRLLFLNTIERDPAGAGTNYFHPNRCRFSWAGDPTNANAYKEPNVAGYGGGGYKDASTTEEITGVRLIKDHLIVYFERSVWELVKTGNPAMPYDWVNLNSELGTQSTFSVVPFDKLALSVGNVGITACNGVNIDRVDDKIPLDIFDIRTINNGIKRVSGIRDYQAEMVYWSWPHKDQSTYSDIFPAKILVYSYKDGAWAYNDDVITTWGYFEQDIADIWDSDDQTWEDDDTTWASGVQPAVNKQVIAGNQQGYTFIVDKDIPYNAKVMQITNAVYAHPTMTLTIDNHTLSIGDYISLSDMNGMTISGSGIHRVSNVLDEHTVELYMPAPPYMVSGTYTGGGLAARVSRIDIVSKQWNPYIKTGNNFRILKIDFCVQKTPDGEITVDFSPNSAITAGDEGISMISEAIATNSLLGTGILDTKPFTLSPMETLQERLWHSVYFQTQGNCIQIRIYLADTEMIWPNISQVPFTLEGLILHTKPTTVRL